MKRPMRPVSRQFSATAKWLHWTVGFLMLSLLSWAWQFPFMAPEDKAGGIPVHASIGLLILILTIMRLAWRRVSQPPETPAGTPGWMQHGARIGHFLLYALLLAQAAIGIWMAAVSPVDIRFFNWLNLSALAPANPAALATMRQIHLSIAILLTATIFGHVAAAFWHHFRLRDDVLIRMLPFGGLWQRLEEPKRAMQERFPSALFDKWPRRLPWEAR